MYKVTSSIAVILATIFFSVQALAQDGEPVSKFVCKVIENFDQTKPDSGFHEDDCKAISNGPKDLPFVHSTKWMPADLPDWGPSAANYPLHGAPGWSQRHYHIESGDIIIAVNDRRVKNKDDLRKAMDKAGRKVVLTVVDPKEQNFVYCVGLELNGHYLPISSVSNIWAPVTATPLGVIVIDSFDEFEAHVYLPTYPRPGEIH